MQRGPNDILHEYPYVKTSFLESLRTTRRVSHYRQAHGDEGFLLTTRHIEEATITLPSEAEWDHLDHLNIFWQLTEDQVASLREQTGAIRVVVLDTVEHARLLSRDEADVLFRRDMTRVRLLTMEIQGDARSETVEYYPVPVETPSETPQETTQEPIEENETIALGSVEYVPCVDKFPFRGCGEKDGVLLLPHLPPMDTSLPTGGPVDREKFTERADGTVACPQTPQAGQGSAHVQGRYRVDHRVEEERTGGVTHRVAQEQGHSTVEAGGHCQAETRTTGEDRGRTEDPHLRESTSHDRRSLPRVSTRLIRLSVDRREFPVNLARPST